VTVPNSKINSPYMRIGKWCFESVGGKAADSFSKSSNPLCCIDADFGNEWSRGGG
jgi:hypothetical protein